MKLKCKHCGNYETFYESGRVTGWYVLIYGSDGKPLIKDDNFSSQEYEEGIDYSANKKLRCCNCKKAVCDLSDL